MIYIEKIEMEQEGEEEMWKVLDYSDGKLQWPEVKDS